MAIGALGIYSVTVLVPEGLKGIAVPWRKEGNRVGGTKYKNNAKEVICVHEEKTSSQCMGHGGGSFWRTIWFLVT